MERGCGRTWSLSASVMLKRSEASPREALGGSAAVPVRSADRLRRGFLPFGQDDMGGSASGHVSSSSCAIIEPNDP